MPDILTTQPTYALERGWRPPNSTSSRLANYQRAQREASGVTPADENDEDAVALAAPQTSAPVAKAPPAAADPMATMFATTAAVGAERKRMAEVFASEHSRGRERGCIALLTDAKGWSAAAILAELPNLPTDRDLNAKDPLARARSDARWAKANGSKSEPVAAAKASSSGDRWADKILAVQGNRKRMEGK